MHRTLSRALGALARSFTRALNQERQRKHLRRLFFEQFEDRRLLAVAVNDYYQVNVSETLTVNGDGAWTNDSYDRSWNVPYWGCTDYRYHEEGWWEDPVWHEGNEEEEGYYDPPEPVWHGPGWFCHAEGWVDDYLHASSTIVSQPAHGTLTPIDTGDYWYDNDNNIAGQYGLAFTYLPQPDFTGADTFTYTLSDDGASSTATVTIDVVEDRDIAMGSFIADGQHLQIQYGVAGVEARPFEISLYASPDGISLGRRLETLTANGSAGQHTITFVPYFDDPDDNYYLLAKVDAYDQVRANNAALLSSGSYLLNNSATGQAVFEIQEGRDGRGVTLSAAGGTLTTDSRPTNPSHAVVPGEPSAALDANGDGVIDQHDADFITDYLAGNWPSWQNPNNRFNVNNDGLIAAADATAVANYLNSYGPTLLDQPRGTAGFLGGTSYFLDVSGDGLLSELDSDEILDFLNGGSGQIEPTSENAPNPLDVNGDGVVDQADQQAVVAYLAALAAAQAQTQTFDTSSGSPAWLLSDIAVRTHGHDVDFSASGDVEWPRMTYDDDSGISGEEDVGLPDWWNRFMGDAGSLGLSGDWNDPNFFDLYSDLQSAASGAGLTPNWNDPAYVSFYKTWFMGIVANGIPHGAGSGGGGSGGGGGGSGGTGWCQNTADLPIIDWDSYDPLWYPETYEGQTETFRFARVGGGSGPVTISVHTEDGPAIGGTIAAVDGVDFTGGSFTVTIPACQTVSDRVSIPLLHDAIIQDTSKTFWAWIDDIQGGVYVNPPQDATHIGFAQLAIDDSTIKAVDDCHASPDTQAQLIDVLANDVLSPSTSNDPGRPQFHVRVDSFTQPSHGTVTFDQYSVAHYVPDSAFVRDDSFTYTITDDEGRYSTATVHICSAAAELSSRMSPVYQAAAQASDVLGVEMADADAAFEGATTAADAAYYSTVNAATGSYNAEFNDAESAYNVAQAGAQAQFGTAVSQLDPNSPQYEQALQELTDELNAAIQTANDDRYSAVDAAWHPHDNAVQAAAEAWYQETETAKATREQAVNSAIQEYNGKMQDLQTRTNAIYQDYSAEMASCGCIGGTDIPPQFVMMEAPQTAQHNFVDTGVRVALAFHKGFGPFNPVFGISSHGFVITDGKGYGFWEKDDHPVGTGEVHDGDLDAYRPYAANLPAGSLYYLTSSIVIDDSEHDPVVFNARLKEFIDDRTANPGTYVAGVRDCFTFVRDALRYALLESRYDPGKPTATEEYYQSTNYWPAKCPLNLFRSGSLPVGPSKLDARAFIKLVN